MPLMTTTHLPRFEVLEKRNKIPAGFMYRPPSSSAVFNDNLCLTLLQVSHFNADQTIFDSDITLPSFPWDPPAEPTCFY